jgi:hypothetical protein
MSCLAWAGDGDAIVVDQQPQLVGIEKSHAGVRRCNQAPVVELDADVARGPVQAAGSTARRDGMKVLCQANRC